MVAPTTTYAAPFLEKTAGECPKKHGGNGYKASQPFDGIILCSGSPVRTQWRKHAILERP